MYYSLVKASLFSIMSQDLHVYNWLQQENRHLYHTPLVETIQAFGRCTLLAVSTESEALRIYHMLLYQLKPDLF